MPGIQFEYFSFEFILLFTSALLVISVLISRISSSFGIPSMLLFLGLGMLAGSEGLGKVPFDNYSVAYAVGSVCLAFILFDGGLRTSWKSVRPILPIGISLSFFGTLITGLVTGIFAHYALNLTWLEGLLLGCIVSSTDAAAVFSSLRSKGLGLKGGLKQILEFEAGSNDPIAIFLTVAVLTYMTSANGSLTSILILFFKQSIFGLLLGWYGAKFFRGLINEAGIEFEGLYGVLMVGLVIILFSVTSYVGGSGFLAVYIAGLVLGNSEYLYKGTIVRFLDGIAWISQILIFLVLGLLVHPSNMFSLWKEGLVLALFMTFAARPISVLIATPGKTLDRRSRLFVSWIGLRGAAPIILATIPWSLGLPNAEYFFDLVFFIVLISVVLQGISIPWVASKLKVAAPLPDEPSDTKFGHVLPSGFISIGGTVVKDAPADQQRIVDIGLPSEALLTSIEREGRYLVPEGKTVLMAGDQVKGFARMDEVEKLRIIFGQITDEKT